MSEIYGSPTTTAVKLCPNCGSALITDASFEQTSSCGGCEWIGRTDDLVVAPFKHEMGSDLTLLQAMVVDLRNILAKDFSTTFGRFLRKWGFISEKVTAIELSQYVVAIAKAVLTTILETREKLEKTGKSKVL